MNKISNPHDKFFKETFSHPEVAQDFLRYYLPASVAELLDVSTLELHKDSFVDPDLQEHFSDLLYGVQLKGGYEGYVYVLLEHKSFPDERVAFQLLRYMVRIWEKELKQEKGLKPIIPVVLYHGKEKWQASTEFGSLYRGPEELRPYFPQFQHQLLDLSELLPQQIYGVARTQIALFILKYIFDPRLAQHLPTIFTLFQELQNKQTALEYLVTVLRYVAATAEHITPDEMKETLKTTLSEGDKTMPTLAQQWIEEGKQLGLQQGQQSLRQVILDSLQLRFTELIPLEITQQLTMVQNLDSLRQLHRLALTTHSLETFGRTLEKYVGPVVE